MQGWSERGYKPRAVNALCVSVSRGYGRNEKWWEIQVVGYIEGIESIYCSFSESATRYPEIGQCEKPHV